MNICRFLWPLEMNTFRLPSPPPATRVNISTPLQSQCFSLLNACTSMRRLKQIHARVILTGLHVLETLAKLLSFCALSPAGSLDYACVVFKRIEYPDTRLCNIMMQAFSRNDSPQSAILLYECMRGRGISLNRFSFPPLLKASTHCLASREGREIHGYLMKMGFYGDLFIHNSLLQFYAVCGSISDALQVFDKMPQRNLVTWDFLLGGLFRRGLFEDVVLCFNEMRVNNIEPDELILGMVISACGQVKDLKTGESIYSYICEGKIRINDYLGRALVHMYTNCGSMERARKLFNEMHAPGLAAWTALVFGYCKVGEIEIAYSLFNQMPEKDTVSWSAMIAGYVENDRPKDALKLFHEMQLSGVKVDHITLLSVISACGDLGALDQGRWIHVFIERNGLDQMLAVKNALIDMYAKCGSLDDSWEVFNKMSERNVITWTTLINGLAVHGHGKAALRLFDEMKKTKIDPTDVTFIGVLYACSHSGLVNNGRHIFSEMTKERGIVPRQEHYGCVVDLLGRANLLDEACELIQTMPMKPNVIVWGALLGACKIHKNTVIGEYAAKQLLQLDPNHDGAHVMLSNIYASSQRWDSVAEMKKIMKGKGIVKEKGCSWIELNNVTHEFGMGDRSHPLADQIYASLCEVLRKLKLIGYAPIISDVLVNLDDE